MSDYYRLEGKKAMRCGLLDWARNFDADGRRVAFDDIEGSKVSTVFLGLDHGWGNGPPLIFETLVLDGPLADEMDRYSTWDEAEAGHKAMCERVRQALRSADTGGGGE